MVLVYGFHSEPILLTVRLQGSSIPLHIEGALLECFCKSPGEARHDGTHTHRRCIFHCTRSLLESEAFFVN